MITFVCGFSRTGTSLVMQMLARAGLRVPGTYPWFETPRWVTGDRLDLSVLEEVDALKWLRPQLSDIPAVSEVLPPCRVIKTTRGLRELAKSQVKYNQQRLRLRRPEIPAMNRAARREAARMAERELKGHLDGVDQAVMQISDEVLVVPFGWLVKQPLHAASHIADFIGQGDPRVMFQAAVRRDVGCQRGMLEHELEQTGPPLTVDPDLL